MVVSGSCFGVQGVPGARPAELHFRLTFAAAASERFNKALMIFGEVLRREIMLL